MHAISKLCDQLRFEAGGRQQNAASFRNGGKGKREGLRGEKNKEEALNKGIQVAHPLFTTYPGGESNGRGIFPSISFSICSSHSLLPAFGKGKISSHPCSSPSVFSLSLFLSSPFSCFSLPLSSLLTLLCLIFCCFNPPLIWIKTS